MSKILWTSEDGACRLVEIPDALPNDSGDPFPEFVFEQVTGYARMGEPVWTVTRDNALPEDYAVEAISELLALREDLRR